MTKVTKFSLPALIGAFFMLWPTNAMAQATPQCGPRAAVAEGLQKKYGEIPVFRALTKANLMFEVFANEATGTWSAIRTWPTGTSCAVDTGQNARLVAPPLEEGPET